MKPSSLRPDPVKVREWQDRSRRRIARTARLAPRTKNKAKRATRFERAFLSREYVAWIHSQPCAIPGCGRRDIQCAHVGKPRSRGGRWYEIAPLCGDAWPGHHQEQEKRTSAVNAKYGIDLEAIAAGLAFEHMAFLRASERPLHLAHPIGAEELAAERGVVLHPSLEHAPERNADSLHLSPSADRYAR